MFRLGVPAWPLILVDCHANMLMATITGSGRHTAYSAGTEEKGTPMAVCSMTRDGWLLHEFPFPIRPVGNFQAHPADVAPFVFPKPNRD
jgi:hypothetical protein